VPDILIRLAIAVALSGMVGWQREVRDRPAGLRTHVLVCVGSAIYTMASLSFGPRTDPARVAAQVATGMGFLGAGTIIRHGNEVRGLTTAASLWTVAAIGIAVGLGGKALWIGLLGTAVTLLTLTVFRRVEVFRLGRPHAATMTLRLAGGVERGQEIYRLLADHDVHVEGMDLHELPEGQGTELSFNLRLPAGTDLSALMGELSRVQGFISIRCS
jgi:putative Mg2+ transporter-C (MgtC) family protein